MFDFGFSEIVLTSAIALIVLGPEKLPKVARQVGNWMGRARSMARQLTEQLEREVTAEDLLKQSKTTYKTGTGAMQSATSTSNAPVSFDTSAMPPHSVAPATADAPMQAAPVPAAPMQAAPPYTTEPASPPHGADWHPAPPENKTSDG